eukprot:1149826-Pelagomonas_calceolata.AAC.3
MSGTILAVHDLSGGHDFYPRYTASHSAIRYIALEVNADAQAWTQRAVETRSSLSKIMNCQHLDEAFPCSESGSQGPDST